MTVSARSMVVPPDVQTVGGGLIVSLRHAHLEPTDDLPLWVVIRKSLA